jgi:RNA-binding protein YhbY
VDLLSGAKISGDEKASSRVINTAKTVKDFEAENQTGNEVFEEISKAYDDLEAGLKENGGEYDLKTRKTLGYLNERLGVAMLQPQFIQAAETILADPGATVESINKFYGNNDLTVEELTAGVDKKVGEKGFSKAVMKAVKSNSKLRELIAIQTLGNIEIDSRNYADAIFGDTPISTVATQENINRFVSGKDEATVAAVSSALGIDMRGATAPEVATAIERARDNGGLEQYREATEAIREAKKVKESTGELPTAIMAQGQGAVRYTVGGEDVAVIRNGNNFRLYDYESGNVSRNLTAIEAIRAIKQMKNASESLKSDGENAIINKSESETQNNEGERIRIRSGGERNGSQNTEGQVSRMEGGAGQTESRRKASQVADSRAAQILDDGQEVSARELGIRDGGDRKVRIVDKSKETPLMKLARLRAERRGLDVTFFVGDNLLIREGGKSISARAYIEGNKVFVRGDHALYTADQLMRHELGHDMIAKGEVDTDEVRRRLEKTVGKEYIDKVAELYTEAYEGTGMTAEEIFEEFVCDSLGDMNVFASDKQAKALLDNTIQKTQKAVKKSKEPAKTRGSPEGKA